MGELAAAEGAACPSRNTLTRGRLAATPTCHGIHVTGFDHPQKTRFREGHAAPSTAANSPSASREVKPTGTHRVYQCW